MILRTPYPTATEIAKTFRLSGPRRQKLERLVKAALRNAAKAALRNVVPDRGPTLGS